MNPLAFLGRIKLKFGFIILVTLTIAFIVNELGSAARIPSWARMTTIAVLALAMVQALAQGMTKPLREMAGGAQKIAKGAYDLRITTDSRDEVGDLARAFNAMAADLAEVDRQRRELVANVSHELRTPITALQALLENLVDGVTEPDPETLDTALQQTQRLGRLVHQLLDLSQLESGVRPLKTEPVLLAELFAQVAREAGLLRSDVRVAFEAPADLTVRADRDLLAHVLINLLGNAVRHSPADETVMLSAAPHDDGVRIMVTDRGPGIPEEARTRVFERFARVDAGRTTEDGGTGLGLAIAKEIVEQHDGAIQVDDRPGCTMIVDLPGASRAEPHPKNAPKVSATGSPATGASVPPAPVVPAPVPVAPVFTAPEVPKAPRWLLPVGAGIGLLGAIVLPYSRIGLGLILVAVALGIGAGLVLRRQITVWSVVFGGLAYALVGLVLFRTAEWLTAPLLLAAFLLFALAISGGGRHGWLGIVNGGLSILLAALPLPWFVRGPLRTVAKRTRLLPIVTALAVTASLFLVFGALFVSADVVFSQYAESFGSFTSVWLDSLPLRVIVFVLTSGLLACTVLAAMRPVAGSTARIEVSIGRSLWAIPLLGLNVLFATFVFVQLSTLFGGHQKVLETAGLTYAEYARSGFFQLAGISVAVLGLVALCAILLRPQGLDRWLLAGLLGSLCVLTLVVVVSAMHRIGLYTEVFGQSRLRASVGATLSWMGAVFVLVLIAGGLWLARRSSTGWLPRTLVAVTAIGLFGFAAWDPDYRVAESQLQGAVLDRYYLATLAPEAVPALDRLPEPTRSCVLREVFDANDLTDPDPWNAWTHARTRAREIVREHPIRDVAQDCTPEGRVYRE